jgi:hypothetical protein
MKTYNRERDGAEVFDIKITVTVYADTYKWMRRKSGWGEARILRRLRQLIMESTHDYDVLWWSSTKSGRYDFHLLNADDETEDISHIDEDDYHSF